MGGAAGTGSFSNPNGPVTGVGGAPMMMSGGAPASDGGTCVVGQFCEPTAPDPDNCGTISFEPEVEVTRTPGNLLIIFDQSGSMRQDWSGGGGTKLAAAQNAVVNAIMPLQDDLTVGAIFFPTTACLLVPPQGGAVAPIDGPGQIPFQPGPQFLAAWQQHWANVGGDLGAGTPMQEAFDRADIALQNAMLSGSVAVVAFTDGEPNCFPVDPFTGESLIDIPTATEPMRAADWLANRNIKTYMVGLPGANGVQILNDVAASGGTGQYILPDDPTQLEMRLREVVQEQVRTGFNSCSMKLNPVPDLPDELLMIVDEPGVGVQQVPRDRGWDITVASGEATIDISGGLCEAAMSGRFSSITFEYACPDSPPPPALPPVE